MATGDIIALISVIVALFALFISLHGTRIARRTTTSGYQSAERVKSDTATLLAALRGIMVKGAIYTQQDPRTRDNRSASDYVDIQPEKAAIQGFIISSTAIAFYAFIAKKSKEANEARRKSEEWRIFFLLLNQLLSTDNQYAAAVLAARIEKMLDRLENSDIEEMSADLEDLSGSIKNILIYRQHDPLLSVFTDRGKDAEVDFEAFLTYLKGQGVKDPDVDLFLAASSGDTASMEDALKRGGRLQATEGDIFRRYPGQLKDFRKASSKS
jgi:hypothetical protein